MSLLKGIDRVRDLLVENTERFAKGLPANNALLWGARGMGKSSLVKAVHAAVNGRTPQERRAQARRDPSRGHREPAGPDGADARRALSLHPVLRRPVVRGDRHLLQVAQGGARRRHRRPAGQCRVLRHLEPPPPDGARDDGERAADRDQSRRSGRGEGLALGPLRPMARIPSLQPGRIPRDGRGLRRALPDSVQGRAARARGARMGDDARRALRPRRLAIRAGSGGTARREAELRR